MKAMEIDKDIILVEDFFTPEECKELIAQSEQMGYEEAMVQMNGSQVMMKNVRDNSRMMFKDHALADRIWKRAEPFCVKKLGFWDAIGLNEMFRVYKYEVGQKFKMHMDGSYVRNNEEQSFYTLMIYLNEDFEGGSTLFRQHEVKPKTGAALIFLHKLRHEGQELKSGVKYVLRTDIMYSSKNAE
jgi:predicted 2-oxoglutarate/Fe(II)-dependent dioxygenase YbiX